LAQLVADPQLRDFLESNGLILPPQQEEVLGIRDHSNALFVITRELEYANEAIYIASYALMYERQVWLVRTPIRTGVVEQRPWQRISSPMFERFSLVGGPLRPGSASGLAVAQKFGGDTAQLSIRLLTELLAGDAARYFQTT
jgi:hypothetical protein